MMNNKKKAPIMRRALYYYSKGAEWFRVFAPDTHHVSGPSVWRWEWQEEGMASAPRERGDRPGTGCFSKRCRNLCSRIVVGAVGDPEPAPPSNQGIGRVDKEALAFLTGGMAFAKG